jgi:hypothetical protein
MMPPCNGDCNQGRECICECKKETKMKHKFYNEIVAWAMGCQIEVNKAGTWYETDYPQWYEHNCKFRIKSQPKCTIKDCQNHVNEGKFIGELCAPCWDYLTNGKGIHSQAYRNAQNKYLYVYEKNGNFFVYNKSPACAPAYWNYIGRIEVQDD